MSPWPKQECPWFDSSEEAKLVASKTLDLCEYLARLRADGALNTDFTRPVGKVASQVPCHLGAHNIGTKSADVLAVHVVRFRMPFDAHRDFERHDVGLVVDHPNERARTVLTPETKRSLAHDLT